MFILFLYFIYFHDFQICLMIIIVSIFEYVIEKKHNCILSMEDKTRDRTSCPNILINKIK